MEKEEEIWKDVKYSNGFYQVSNLGRVKSMGFSVGNPWNDVKAQRKGKVLKPIVLFGYEKVNVYYNDTKLLRFVHRIVSEVFIPNPDNKRCVNHKDYNRRNNRVDNLEWTTQKENIHHAMQGPHWGSGENHPTATVSDATAEKVRILRKYGLKYAEIAFIMDVSMQTVWKIVKKRKRFAPK